MSSKLNYFRKIIEFQSKFSKEALVLYICVKPSDFKVIFLFSK